MVVELTRIHTYTQDNAPEMVALLLSATVHLCSFGDTYWLLVCSDEHQDDELRETWIYTPTGYVGFTDTRLTPEKEPILLLGYLPTTWHPCALPLFSYFSVPACL